MVVPYYKDFVWKFNWGVQIFALLIYDPVLVKIRGKLSKLMAVTRTLEISRGAIASIAPIFR